MRDLYTPYVYVVDLEAKRVINTIDTVTATKKRLIKNPDYYGTNHDQFVYVQVNVTSPLIQLKTNELSGYDIIQNAMLAGIVSDVEPRDVLQKLYDNNLAKEVVIDEPEKPAETTEEKAE